MSPPIARVRTSSPAWIAFLLAAALPGLAPPAGAQVAQAPRTPQGPQAPQTPKAPQAPQAQPDDPKAPVPPVVHRSAFVRPPAAAPVPVGSWSEANRVVDEIGGWKAYLKEAHGTPAQPEKAK